MDPRLTRPLPPRVIVLMLPTLSAGILWVASGFGRPQQPLLGPSTTRLWLTPNYIHLYRTGAGIVLESPRFGSAGTGQVYLGGLLSMGRGESWQGTALVPVWNCSVSLVIPLLLTLPTAVLAYRAWKRHVMTFRGRCPICDYDLRASCGRCPECGWTIPASFQRI